LPHTNCAIYQQQELYIQMLKKKKAQAMQIKLKRKKILFLLFSTTNVKNVF